MVDIARESNFRRNLFITLGAALLLIGAFFVGRRLYRTYEPMRLTEKARGYLKNGDERSARMTLRRAFAVNPNDAGSLRLFAELADKHREKSAVEIRVKLVSLEPESVAARIECAETALRYGEPGEAKKALDYENENAVARSAPRFHELAGKTARALRDPKLAVEHFEAALRAEPQNAAYQADYATALLERGFIEDRAAARQTLERLAKTPEFRVSALRTLIRDSSGNREYSAALALARDLASGENAEFPDRITFVDLLRRTGSPELRAELEAVKAAARANPQRISTVLIWLNQNGHAADALAWFDGFSREEWADTRVTAAAAMCSLTVQNWPLVETLAQGNWGRLEFVRYALLARALREQAKPAESGRNWELAIDTAKKQPGAPKMLMQMVAEWGFSPQEMKPLLTAAVSDSKTDDDFVQALLPRLGKEKDTRVLWHAMSRFYAANPENDAAGNNFAIYSLLLRENVSRAKAVAEKLYRKYPTDPRFVSTYAFALHVSGESKEALSVLESLTAEELKRPEVAAYHGIILAAVGDRERARHSLELAENADLLPEEGRLVHEARTAAR